MPSHTDRLVDLVLERLPFSVESSGELHDWGVVGPGLIVAAAEHVRAVSEQQQRMPCALIEWQLVRALFEYVVTFAWIAAEPAVRSPRWLRHEYEERIKLHNDLLGLGEEPLLTDEALSAFRKFIANVPKTIPDLRSLALRADRDWAETFESINDLFPADYRRLELLYALVFRNGSRFTHPTSDGVALFVSGRAPDFEISAERPLQRDISVIAASLLALQLAIATSAVPQFGITKDELRAALT